MDRIRLIQNLKFHRLQNKVFEISDPDNYFEVMLEAGVVVDRNKRKEKIINLINKSSELLNLSPDLSEGLVDELTDLVESPILIRGNFNKEFLSLPVEVLSTVMKTHQRYIPLLTKNKSFSKLDLSSQDKISTKFFVVSNGLEESTDIIAKGNEKVLKARFSDAKFFVESDKKNSSEYRNEKLRAVSYLKGFGSVFQRVERIIIIAEKILSYLNDESLEDKKVLEAARFCKNDLSSEIVYEFPELQGIIGGKYMKNEGFSEEVCLAVAEHYLPCFYKDALPSTIYGAIVSISDKLETLISIFISGKRPSGSSDPYALRRSLNGIIQIMWEFEIKLSFENIFENLLDYWKLALPNLNFKKEQVLEDLIEFTEQRIINHLEELSISKDLIKAVCFSEIGRDVRITNLINLKKRFNTIKYLKEKDNFIETQKVISRITKLAKNSSLKTDILYSESIVSKDFFEKDCEFKAYKLIKELEKLNSLPDWDYLKMFNLFEINVSNLNELFDNKKGVLFMTENKEIRNNRLNLIAVIRNYSLKIADFTLLNS